jgi:hypothetical protein
MVTCCTYSSVVYYITPFLSQFQFLFRFIFICKYFFIYFIFPRRQTCDETLRPYTRDSRGEVMGQMSKIFHIVHRSLSFTSNFYFYSISISILFLFYFYFYFYSISILFLFLFLFYFYFYFSFSSLSLSISLIDIY